MAPPKIWMERKSQGVHPFLEGFLVSVSNPLTSVTFLLFFSTVIKPQTPLSIQFFYLLCLLVTSVFVYSFIVFFFSTQRVRQFLLDYAYIASAIMGGVMIFWAISIWGLKSPY